MIFSGPLFFTKECDLWKGEKYGGHYNIFACKTKGMDCLLDVFPTPDADAFNFCLFSTSGIHGHYGTIEDAEKELNEGPQQIPPSVTFLIVQPRLVTLRYGNCYPADEDDIIYMKRLRESSLKAIKEIGK